MKPYIKHLFFTFPVLAFHGIANFLVKLFDGQAWEADLSKNNLAANVIFALFSGLFGLLGCWILYSIYLLSE